MANPKIETVLTNLTREVTEARGAMASAVVYIKGVPDLIKAAVDAADLTPEQEAVFADLTAQLDAGEQEIVDALSTNPTPTP